MNEPQKPRYEANQELSGWAIWDNDKQEYIAGFGSHEEACKGRVKELNAKADEGSDE